MWIRICYQTQNSQWKEKALRRVIWCSQAGNFDATEGKYINAWRNVYIKDDFETIRYLGPQWQEIARNPVKLGIKWPNSVTPGTVDVRISAFTRL